ncbi:MAG: Adenylate cyclase 2 [Pseudidiomarina mangrovi]|nr:MAG: Adenylate cyclase 2 [Pseudidiomarina mangrovi]
MTRTRWLQTVGSAILVLWLAGEQIGLWPSQLLQRLEWISYDQRVNLNLPGDAPADIVIVDIDEASLAEFGQWPWPRDQVAALIERLFQQQQIALLGLDIVFAEQEQNLLAQQWQQLLLQYPQLADQPAPTSGDQRLAAVMQQYPIVSGFYFDRSVTPNLTVANTGQLPAPLPLVTATSNSASGPQLTDLPLVTAQRYASNLAMLQQQALHGGFFDNPMVDDDGIFRRVPLLQRYQQQLYPSLPLAMLQTLLAMPPVTLETHLAGGLWQLEAVDVGGYRLPTDPHAAVLVPWYGPRGSFTHISAAELLASDLLRPELSGAIVLLGTSAPGLMDLRSTPVGAVFPGVEIHASVLAGLLQLNLLSEPGYAIAITVILLLLLGSLLTWCLPKLPALWLVALCAALLTSYTAANLYAWQQGLLLPLASGLLLIMVLMGWHLALNFWRESQAKQQVTNQFGLYVPPELVNDIVANPEALDLTGQERQLTVLFSDVRGFTSFAENLAPAQLTRVMNQLLSPVTRAIHQHRGTIDKYMGDAVMAFWGAPLADSEHAWHAVQGALAMQRALADSNREFVQQGLPALQMGIGVHTGLMSVGNMGSDFRMAYTVMGDNVNLGSRIEALSKTYGAHILLSADTVAALGARAAELPLRPVDLVRVKGRQAPVQLLELLLNDDQHSIDITRKAWDYYQQGDFAAAKACYEEINNQQLGLLFCRRCTYYLDNPPPKDWDGVFTHLSKA